MKAVVMTRPGPPEVLRVEERPSPTPGPGEVVVRVDAAGVCYHDVLDRAGKIPGAHAGAILGHEVAGEVVAADDPAQLGRRVVVFNRVFCARCAHCLAGRQDLCRRGPILGSGYDGGYGELVRVPATHVVDIPAGVPSRHAAFACCPVGTSVRALVGVAGVRPGDIVLVNGASGGLGLHQIQVAKALGATVIAVSTSAGKAEVIRAVGADEVVVAPDLDYSGPVWSLTGKRGVDVVMENLATGTLGSSLRSLHAGGIAVVMGNIGVEDVVIDPGLLISRRLRVVGSGNPLPEDVRRALALMADGSVTPVIADVLPFPEAHVAHERMEARGTTGRLVLEGW